MSERSWLEAYYPKPAEDCTGSELEAVEHAILKFEGLKPEALEDHKVKMVDADVVTVPEYDTVLEFSTTTCAICIIHAKGSDWGNPDCKKCILHKIRGMQCHESEFHSEDWSHYRAPYQQACYEDNVEPMLELLYEAKRRLEDSNREKDGTLHKDGTAPRTTRRSK